MYKKALILAVPALALMTLAGCKQPNQGAADSTSEPKIVVEDFADTVELELVLEEEEPEVMPVVKQRVAPRPAAKTTFKGKPETIYVETDGAQGRVWGHVTMRGDRGTGTIHDWDENTLAVSVTRHGNELFAVDQNSRQYVFKLKK